MFFTEIEKQTINNEYCQYEKQKFSMIMTTE